MASDARWEIGDTYLAAGWYRLAANTFERFWLSRPRHPRSPEALRLVGEILADRLDRKASAAEVFERVASDYPYSFDAPEALLKGGQCWLEVGVTDRARAAYDQILKEYPTSHAAPPARESLEIVDVYLLEDWETARTRLEEEAGDGRDQILAEVAFENLKVAWLWPSSCSI